DLLGAGFLVLGLLHLAEIQLHGRRATENLHRHLQAVLLVIHRLDYPIEIIERPIDDAHHLAGLEQHFGLGFVDSLLDPTQDAHRFLVADRRRLLWSAADEAQHLRDFLHKVPGGLVHLHLHQHVAGKELAIALALLPVAHLDHFLGRHQDLAELILEALALDALLESFGHAVLEIGIRVNDVPPQSHFQPPRAVSQRVRNASSVSNPQKNKPSKSTITNTTMVTWVVSWRLGQTTLRSSMRELCTNVQNVLPWCDCSATSAPPPSAASTMIQRSQIGRSASQ